MTDRIGIVPAFSKPEAKELAGTITTYLESRDIRAVPEKEIVAGATPNVDAIVVLGGDGLMMRMANSFPDVPLIGINFGKVGFLALVEQADWKQALDLFLAGDYQLDESSTLQSSLIRGDQEDDQGWAINDVVIRSGNRMIEVEVYVDGVFVNQYPSDGLIVSTPRGSTAYCMAAGGPVLAPGVKGFAVVPISSHSPIRTPMIIAEHAVIELVSANAHPASLILDGQLTNHLRQNDLIRITKGEHTFKLVRVSTTSFYAAFREKFNFQTRPNAVPSRMVQPGTDTR
ncbi:MAG: NAD(+)/NADH kinase [Thermomicrobiales bacterium]|nr:NAD(+)/NADH kinase [Thermomicrobiales bacterium]MCO5218727.1 NAD(+)/NADH kinase [Thermomicrobiales bacterium]MCO5225754.1 NAD(+)/NADH kinase [Thermomicrobiales bacterium]